MSEKKRTVIGRYEIIGKLGEGAMAAVYKAYDPRFKREVALKVLRRRFATNATIIERFHREALAIAQLEHPAIVPIYDAGRDGDWVYIVMRYMSGGTLADRMGRLPEMSVDEMTQVIERVSSAFDMAHGKGIIHRDIKPANILFDQTGAPFLADFGIVKVDDSSKKSLTVIDDGAPVGSAAIGTPEYMSPEQVRGDRTVDGRSDIYSLGVVLYEMLSGEPPFIGEGTLQTAIQHTTNPVPKIGSVAPKYKKWQSILDKAMAKKREKRYQSGRAFADAVIKMGRSDTRSFGTRTIPAAGQTNRSRLPLALGGLALLFLLGGTGAFLFTQQRPAEEIDTAATEVAFQEMLQETADAQDTLIVSMQETTAAQQAAQAAEFAETREAFEATSDAANAIRETEVAELLAELAETSPEECTTQNDYDFEIGRIKFTPRIGSVIEENEVIETIAARWDVVNEGCPALNVRLVGEDGSERIPTFVDATGDGKGNTILEGENVEMFITLGSIDEANGVDETLRFVVDAPNGEVLMLDGVEPIKLTVPDDETWIAVTTPTSQPEPTETEVVEAVTDESTNEPTESANVLAGETSTVRPTPPQPTDTARPQSTATSTPDWNATREQEAAVQQNNATATARVLNATRTIQAETARNNQTRDAYNNQSTATVRAQQTKYASELTQEAQNTQATQTRQAMINRGNADATATRQAQIQKATADAFNAHATQTRQAQIGAGIATQTRQAQINAANATATANAQKATGDAYNAQATRTRQAQVDAGKATQTRQAQINAANATATANAQNATADAYNAQATQTRQAEINAANATATQNAKNSASNATATQNARNANATATARARPTNTPIPIPPTNTPRPQPTQPPAPPPTPAVVPPSIIGAGTCVVGGNGFITDQTPFRWSWNGSLNGRTFSIRVVPRGESPQAGGTYIKMNMANDVNVGNGVWQTSGFGTGLKPGEYSWAVALVDGFEATFSTNTGCLINTE